MLSVNDLSFSLSLSFSQRSHLTVASELVLFRKESRMKEEEFEQTSKI